MTLLLPKDDDNNPIQALRLKDGAAHKMIATNTSVTNTIPFNIETKVISIFCTENIYIEFGNNSIIANNNSHFFPAGVYYDFAINNLKQAKDTHIAILKAGANDAIVYISEKE